MSCYEWEEGTIKLPTAAILGVRNAVRDAVEAHATLLYDKSQEFWKALKPRHKADAKLYGNAVEAFLWGNRQGAYAFDATLPAWRGFSHGAVVDDLSHLLGYIVLPHHTAKPRRVTQADVAKLIGKPTGAKFTIRSGELSIGFDGRNLHWQVDENNHSCDRAHEHPFAIALFRALDRVTWTRGSGGSIVGNNEYNRDSRDQGGGGNYVVCQYGPAPRVYRRGMPYR